MEVNRKILNQNKNNYGKSANHYRITISHLGNRFNRCKEMKTQVLTSKEQGRV